MAIENIQYVYDHIGLYRRSLRPVNNQFFMRLQKEQRKENKKFNLNLRENAVEAVKPYFAPQNMLN